MESEALVLLRREVNDRTFASLQRFAAEEADFACECGGADCRERVNLLAIEYAARDDKPLLAPGHKRVVAATP